MNLKQKLSKKMKKTGGFTLIEMLIVVAIIAILVVVSIPMVSSSLDKAKQATDDANERAAKAAALIQFMTDAPGADTPYHYNAESGQVQATSSGIEAYGQTKDHDGEYIQVTVTKDGIIEEDGISWVAAPKP